MALETRSVIVSAEALDQVEGSEGDTIVYTATVKDNLNEALPDSFQADLEINSTKVISAQVFDAAVYDPVTFLLTLPWTVPAITGSLTVKLSWTKQVI